MLLLIAPAVAAPVFFQIIPILTGANASFRDWSLHDPEAHLGRLEALHLRADRPGLRLGRDAQHHLLHGRQRRRLARPGPGAGVDLEPEVSRAACCRPSSCR